MLTISKYHLIIKDSEGYVFKKLESEVSPDEKIISEKEYMKVSVLLLMKRNSDMVEQENII